MERQLAELALGLRRHGCSVTVIARTCELPADAGIAFRRVRGPARPFLLGYPWFMLMGSLAVRRWRKGVVQATGAIVLNRVDVIAVHYCHQAGLATPSRPSLLFRWYVRIVGRVKRAAERFCFSHAGPATRFVCVSEGVSAEMREHYPKLADRIVTIYNGVDTSTFSPGKWAMAAAAKRREAAIPPGRNIAAFVGGEWERKGLRLVLEALPLAPDWDLVVAGRGDEGHYREIAASLGVGQAVHWLGVTREIQVVYSMADAFVLPSRYETFSLVTFEAAASALPIIAAPVSGVRELIEDEENGFLIHLDAGEIARRLNRLAEDPMLSERLGQAARQSALRFGWDVMVSDHRRLYSEVAARSRVGSI